MRLPDAVTTTVPRNYRAPIPEFHSEKRWDERLLVVYPLKSRCSLRSTWILCNSTTWLQYGVLSNPSSGSPAGCWRLPVEEKSLAISVIETFIYKI